MRDFNDVDRKKKTKRIRIKENPCNLSQEMLLKLEETVKASLKDGYLSCPVAWEIAQTAKVPRIAIGEITDRLGVRITDCQLGCFKVDKTPYDSSLDKDRDKKIIAMLEQLKDNEQLTCTKAFDMAQQINVMPIMISNEANERGLKIHNCQLGCF